MKNLVSVLSLSALALSAGCSLIYSGVSSRADSAAARAAAPEQAPVEITEDVQSPVDDFDFAAFWAMPTNLAYNTAFLSRGEDEAARWQGVMFTSEMYQGQPMRVFGWYATPKGKGPFPAVLSLHGAGGGAELERAKEFARAGYACLSIDWNAFNEAGPKWTEGDPLPACEKTVYCGIWYQNWPGHFCMPGPDGDWKWCALYRAATAARRGLAWMAMRPEIDGEKLAVEGHSFGGFLSQLVAGIEPRVKAVVSSAAAGAWKSRIESGTEAHAKESGLTLEQGYEFLKRYDPASGAANIKAPMLLRLAAADFFGSCETIADYWGDIDAPKAVELMPGNNHHFFEASARIAWFDCVFRGAPEYPRIESWKVKPALFGRKWNVSLRAAGGLPVKYAEISWTTSTNAFWKDREWCSAPLASNGDGVFEGAFEPVATGAPLRFFVTVLDEAGRGASILPETRELRSSGSALAEPVRIAKYACAAAPSAAMSEKDWARVASVGPAAREASTLSSEGVRFSAVRNADSLLLRIAVRDSSPWRAKGEPGAMDKIRVTLAPPGEDAGKLALAWEPDEEGGAVPADEATPPASISRFDGGYALVSEIPYPDGPFTAKLKVDFGCCLAPECLGTVKLSVECE